MSRRLFIGDLHGCRDEFETLLEAFGYQPGHDQIFSVGDVVGKGPFVAELLVLLHRLQVQCVRGNHEDHLLKAYALPPASRSSKQQQNLDSLNSSLESLSIRAPLIIDWMHSWPLYLDLNDILLVHAGLIPGLAHPKDMKEELLMNIRTWDGIGKDLKSEKNPPWYECKHPEWKKTVVFGHWAARGLIDLKGFKGLDTGCVYGRQLSAWCPEENRFYHVDSQKCYRPIELDSN